MEARLKEAIRKYVRERNIQKTLDEMSVTANVAGYDTPNAFAKPGQTKKKNNRLASITGGTVVDNLEEGEKDWALGDVPASRDEALPMKPTAAKKKPGAEIADVSGMIMAENRWVALKKEDSTPTQKIGRGMSNIHKQLREMEQFLSWYGKIKNENGVSNKNFWKRTNSHIYSIKERLLKLDQQIRKISE